MATDTKVPLLTGCVWMLFVVSVSFLALRLYTQMFIKKRDFLLDDYIVLLALGLFLAFSITITVAAKAGLGGHLDGLDLEAIATVRKYALVAQTLSIVGAGISKLALGLLLLRIVFQPWHQVALMVPMVIVLVISAVAVVLLIKLKEKITVATGLGIGVLAGACGIARTYALPQFTPRDFTYDQVDQIILTAAEWAVTLICNSIPVLFPLWRRMVHGSNYSSNGYGGGGGDRHSRGTAGGRAFSRAYRNGNASIRLESVPRRQATTHQKYDLKMGLIKSPRDEELEAKSSNT